MNLGRVVKGLIREPGVSGPPATSSLSEGDRTGNTDAPDEGALALGKVAVDPLAESSSQAHISATPPQNRRGGSPPLAPRAALLHGDHPFPGGYSHYLQNQKEATRG